MNDLEFDDIRAYRDAEIPAAMQRVVKNELFPVVAHWVYPDESLEQVAARFLSFTDIRSLQEDLTQNAIRQLLKRSVTELTLSGSERLDPSKSYLFVSNHRDIVLDATLLSYRLYLEGFDTPEITFGANLMMSQLIIDLGKSNKMFRVERPGGSMREFYVKSMHLSKYMRQTLLDRGQSVWIAQRNGRTKDGNDRTDQGIVNMFGMSGGKDLAQNLGELNIVPLSISYEWESCDWLKAMELYARRDGQPYVKKEGEDLNSILTGINQPKGNIHISVCRPLELSEIQAFNDQPRNEFNRLVAGLIDQRILSEYRLMPTNYIAYDLLYGERYADRYTKAQQEAFLAHLAKGDAMPVDDKEALKAILLGIYANPVKNQLG